MVLERGAQATCDRPSDLFSIIHVYIDGPLITSRLVFDDCDNLRPRNKSLNPSKNMNLVVSSLMQSIRPLYAHRLWRRVVESGKSVRRSDLMAELLGAQAQGDVDVSARQWRYVEPSAVEPGPAAGVGGKPPSRVADHPTSTTQLLAVRAQVELGEPQESPALPPPPDGKLAVDWALFRRLLAYYRECLRVSAKSGTIQFASRHRQQFQLVQPDALWWPRGAAWPVLSIPRTALDPKLLEALYNRQDEPVFLGYPTDVFATKDGEFAIKPIVIFRTEWSLDGDRVRFAVTDRHGSLNPEWIQGMRRNRRVARMLDWLGAETSADSTPVSTIGKAEWDSMEDLARTLSMFIASDIRGALDPTRPVARIDLSVGAGVYNAIGLYLTEQNKYTAGVRRDLATLQSWPDQKLEETALSAIFGAGNAPDKQPPKGASQRSEEVPVLLALRLGEDQIVAAEDALRTPLTVVTGPPGTGKSQTAAAIMVSAALAGRSALFSSRAHQAIDAVDGRFREMSPERTLLNRASRDRENDFDFRVAIDALLARQADGAGASQLRARLPELAAKWAVIRTRFHAADQVQAATEAYASLESELRYPASMPAGTTADRARGFVAGGWFRRLEALVRGWLGRARTPDDTPFHGRASNPPSAADFQAAEVKLVAARETLARLQSEISLPDAISDLQKAVEAVLPSFCDSLEYVPVEERQALANLRGELGLSRDAELVRNLWAENAAILLRHFPLWAVTALSVPSRIPLQPGMFDHVVIDEATTCDIAAALPLLARARRATIVGDPMQTGLVGDIDAGRERAILEKEGLWLPGVGRFSFSQTSLFHLAQSTASARRHMLRDHFRCHSEIADFISEQFYGRRLAVLTDEARLRPPPGATAGLHWTPVVGALQSAGQGCASDVEASAIARHLHELLEDRNYRGTVGVVTPFKRQAELIRRYAEQRLSHVTIERADLRVATGHAFQGDARDVILISPCYGQDMPQGARWFLGQGASLFNVAVSRARAVCHIFGDLDACERSDIPHLARLARRIKSPPFRAKSDGQQPFESPWEESLYNALLARGIQTEPQYRIAGRRLDLAYVDGERKFDIEVDGDAYHRDPDGFRKVSDLWRDHQLQSLGWRVIRFWVYELKKNMEACVERVASEISR